MKMEKIISNHHARSLILYTQRLIQSQKSLSQNSPSNAIFDLIKDLVCIQIDTINVLHRSQYLTIWSRLGNYNIEDFDKLVYGSKKERKLFEYWFHCASIVPYDYYRYRLHKMKNYIDNGSKFYSEFTIKENQILLRKILKNIKDGIGSQSRHFDDKKPEGGWWNWKLSKKALELLYCRGELMIDGRPNFNKSYNIAEKVIPEWVDRNLPSIDETNKFILALSAKTLGLATYSEIASYSFSNITTSKNYILDLVKKKTLITVKVEKFNGGILEMLVHKDNLDILNLIEKGNNFNSRTTFLNPFDNLFWAKKRTFEIFGFTQSLEAYKPEASRIWGYYTMPVLYKNSLIGRIEPKMDRNTEQLIIKNLFFEDTIEIDDKLIFDLAETINSLGMFHKAKSISITGINQKQIKLKILSALKSGGKSALKITEE